MLGPSSTSPAPPCRSPLVRHAPPGLVRWLHRESLCLFVSTYQQDRLILLSAPAADRLDVAALPFDRPMGLSVTPDTVSVATRLQIRTYRAEPGNPSRFHLRSVLPTGFLDAHDLVAGQDAAYLVDTHHSCLRRLGERAEPVWRPPFVSALAPEDRCHLNGLALLDGAPALATALSVSDAPQGWRTSREGGGILLDIPSREVLATGLSMPHSPRFHRGEIWLLNAGTGELGTIDAGSGGFRPVAGAPGFLRGLAFHQDHAVAGLSRLRPGRKLPALPLPQGQALCGLAVVDLARRSLCWVLEFGTDLEEIYDVQVLPLETRPVLLPESRLVR